MLTGNVRSPEYLRGIPKQQKTENAWAAGFFDGEGCIGVSVRREPPPLPYPTVQIVNNDLDSIAWFRDRFFPGRKIVSSKNSLNAFSISTSTPQTLREFFAAIRPFSRLKKEQIDIALRMLTARETKDVELAWMLRDEMRAAKGPNVSGPKPKPRSYWETVTT